MTKANETDGKDFSSRHCSTFAFTGEHVQYVQRYGGECRNCADEDGVCPQSGLPCGESEKAIRYVLGAVEYGVRHQFIKNPNTTNVADNLRKEKPMPHGSREEYDERTDLAEREILSSGGVGNETCPKCGKRFKTPQGVADHTRDVHSGRTRTNGQLEKLSRDERIEAAAEWANSQMTVGEEQDFGV